MKIEMEIQHNAPITRTMTADLPMSKRKRPGAGAK